ncbi:MAG: insulinase family protein [Bacteroidaceae bacterium]|nr:insulinase family protein [Bacteroidaceae bacterium]
MRKSLTIFLLAVLTTAYAAAQGLPLGPDVRTGQLPNGLTYYVRHNAMPAGRAYFYLAQKVGAIQEEPNQRGLAHFLEHMCFNGTTHFPANSMTAYLESIGVQFGTDVNAYTAVDETVYNIDNVPVGANADVVDSCLLILRDWADGLLLEPAEIDKERGVIQEEWRRSNNANQRLAERMMPVIMAGSKYADAMPIGSMETVRTFKPQVLRQYYERWYRPDLQGIVVVGDIDADVVEAKINKLFHDIEAPSAAAPERIYYPVPTNKEPIVFIGTDQEYSGPDITLFFKHKPMPRAARNSVDYLADNLLDNAISQLFSGRVADMLMKPEAPFLSASLHNGAFFLANTMEALNATVGCKPEQGAVERAVRGIAAEMMRIRQHGFTATEFDRFKQMFAQSLANREPGRPVPSATYVQAYVSHFLDNTPAIDVAQQLSIYNQLLQGLTAEHLNMRYNELFTDSNLVMVVKASEAERAILPSEQQLVRFWKEACSQTYQPYEDIIVSQPFLPETPVAGSVVSQRQLADGTQVLKLSNGAQVWYRHSDYPAGEVRLQALAEGGSSCFPPQMFRYTQMVNMVSSLAGLGNYSRQQMSKAFAGVRASAAGSITTRNVTLTASGTAKSLTEMMQQVYAVFRCPHRDEQVFRAVQDNLRENLINTKNNPDLVFQDSAMFALYGHTPYTAKLTPADVDRVTYDQLLSLRDAAYADASAFTFYIVGDVSLDSLRPHIEQYIASLPGTGRTSRAQPVMPLRRGRHTTHFALPQPTPKASLRITYSCPRKFSLRNQVVAGMLGQLLTMEYNRTIREEAGAAYSITTGGSQTDYPTAQASVSVSFTTSPEQYQTAVSLVDEGLKRLATEGPTEAALGNVRSYLLKTFESNRKQMEYGLFQMNYMHDYGVNYTTDYPRWVTDVTAADIRKLARQLQRSGNRIEVVMLPETQ